MKKLLLLVLALVGCVPPSDIRSAKLEERIETGSLIQGSRSWREHNLCDAKEKSDYCIEVVRGPFILTGVDSGDSCSHSLAVGIADTYRNTGNIDPNWLSETKVHWTMTSPPNTRLYIKDIQRVIPAGESLFIHTSNDLFNDNTSCYVTWVGYRPK